MIAFIFSLLQMSQDLSGFVNKPVLASLVDMRVNIDYNTVVCWKGGQK